MRIAVISDTHNRIPAQLPGMLREADEIWHLGDVCDRAILDSLSTLGPPLRVVRGNCDGCMEWPVTLDFELEGFRIRLVHIPPRQAPIGVTLLLHGHTHVPRDERVGAARFLNPGAVSKANKGAPPGFAWLELRRGEPPAWSPVRLGTQ